MLNFAREHVSEHVPSVVLFQDLAMITHAFDVYRGEFHAKCDPYRGTNGRNSLRQASAFFSPGRPDPPLP